MKLVKYHSSTGTRACLWISEGRTYIKIITLDRPARIHKVPREDARYMKDIPETRKNNPQRFIKILRQQHIDGGKPVISEETKVLLGYHPKQENLQ
jgi:hypothetical protein